MKMHRNNVFKKISPEIYIPMKKTRVCRPHLPWINTSPLIIIEIMCLKRHLQRDIYSNEKTRVCRTHLPWTNTSPLIITHACRDVGLSFGAWIESQKRYWASLSCESSVVCSFGTLSSFLSSSVLSGLIFPWSCAATATENSHVQTPRCVSETLCHYSLYLPWWFLGLRRSCDSDSRLCF